MRGYNSLQKETQRDSQPSSTPPDHIHLLGCLQYEVVFLLLNDHHFNNIVEGFWNNHEFHGLDSFCWKWWNQISQLLSDLVLDETMKYRKTSGNRKQWDIIKQLIHRNRVQKLFVTTSKSHLKWLTYEITDILGNWNVG